MSRPRFWHRVRFKLLLVALTLLVIPWAGYRYIEETESFLRRAQENVLLGTAQAIATVLHNRRDLFEGDIQLRDTLAGAGGLTVVSRLSPAGLPGLVPLRLLWCSTSSMTRDSA